MDDLRTESRISGGVGTTVQGEQKEAGMIESQAIKLPTDAFLWAAGASIVVSLSLQMMGRKEDALFVGQWVPSFLILGLHSRLMRSTGAEPY